MRRATFAAAVNNFMKFLFWYFFPAPKIGDEYVHSDHFDDPWRTSYERVIKREGNWFRLRSQNGWERSIHRSVLVGFYKKISRPVVDDDVPW